MSDSLEKQVEKIFSKGSTLAKATPGYEPRQSQIEFAKAVARAFARKKSLIVEAGTGTGKTFAYLVPALLHGGKVLISTAGKALQEQLYNKDIPAVVKALGLGAKVAILKGRKNYICLNRLETAMGESVARNRQEVQHIQDIYKFAHITKTGDRSDTSTVPDNSGIWHWVTGAKETCVGSDCPYFQDCFVFKARDKAKDADILVINHHLFLADMALKDEAYTDFLPEFDLVIFDEAHQLPSIATDFFSENLSLTEIKNFAEEVMVLGIRKLPKAFEWRKLATSVKNRCDDIRQKFTSLGLPDDYKEELNSFKSAHLLAEPLEKLSEAIKGLADPLDQIPSPDPEADNWKTSADEFLEKIAYWKKICASQDSTDTSIQNVQWISLSQKNAVFSKSPVSTAASFKKHREEQGKAWILTSATLSADNNFDHFKEEMGLVGVEAKSWGSPFKFSSQGMLYIPEKIVGPNDPSFSEAVVKAAWPLIKEFNGKTLFLCTTIRALDRIGDELRRRISADNLSITVLVQNEYPKQELLRRFREDEEAVLVGSMSFWEGIDIKGEALSLVVIDKIPFMPPNDPIYKGKSKLLKAQGKDPFTDYSLPEAITLLRQGAGRLIRDYTDNGVLMICDNRILKKRYGKAIWSSLPDFARTKVEQEALEFIADIKKLWKGNQK